MAQPLLRSGHHHHLDFALISILFLILELKTHLPLKPINPPLGHAFSTPFLQAPQL